MRGDLGHPVRLRFTKQGKVRFVSHRDVARAFERAFRIEALPLAFTQGFSPRPKVSFGLALSVGHESLAEYLDLELAEPVDVPALPRALSEALPEGIEVTGASPLAARAPALQEAVTAVDWELALVGADDVASRVAALMDAGEVVVTRRRKGRDGEVDIRPALRTVTVRGPGEHGVRVDVESSVQPSNVRPNEIVSALGEGIEAARVVRTGQWIEREGARLEPLDADAPRALEARAS